MQAQTVLERLHDAEELWARLAGLMAERKLPERFIPALYNAALGLRVRRTSYQQDAEIESATAGRDLRNLTEAGLLTARGETRGRYYVGSDELRAIYRDLRTARPRRLTDPYDETVADLGPRPRRHVSTVEPK